MWRKIIYFHESCSNYQDITSLSSVSTVYDPPINQYVLCVTILSYYLVSVICHNSIHAISVSVCFHPNPPLCVFCMFCV